MMDWTKIINKILGKFWLNIFRDNWICELIVKFFRFCVGQTIYSRLNIVNKQLRHDAEDLKDYVFPRRILLSSKSNTSTIHISDMYISTSVIGESSQNIAYKKLTLNQIPTKLKKTISSQVELVKDIDYKVTKNSIEFKIPLHELGFSKKLITINNELFQCYQLWGFEYQKYQSILDRFTWILQLPSYWVYKYPSAVKSAWDIKINGPNKNNLKQFLSSLSTQTKILTYKDNITFTDIPYLDIITDTGILKAKNSKLNSITYNGVNILPLSGDSIQDYKILCAYRSADDKIPFVDIPDNVNPVQFLIKKIWKSSFLFVLTRGSNRQDIKKAVQFIYNNIPRSVTFFAYDGNNYDRLFPTELTQSKLNYYKDSINNKLILKMK